MIKHVMTFFDTDLCVVHLTCIYRIEESNSPDKPPVLMDAAFYTTGSFALACGGFSYIASFITGNDSWVDRMWSLMPPAYALLTIVASAQPTLPSSTTGAAASGALNQLIQKTVTSWKQFGTTLSHPTSLQHVFGWNTPTLIGGVILIWGSRLTYNFYRKGGYQKGEEDYRWKEVRALPGLRSSRLLWHAFSFGFISMFQHILLWGITLPMITSLKASSASSAPSVGELCVAGAMLGFVLWEGVADQQQWLFQNRKRGLLLPTGPQPPAVAARAQADYKRGFCTTGLFRISRHPNVFSEQMIWVSLAALNVLNYATLEGSLKSHGMLSWTTTSSPTSTYWCTVLASSWGAITLIALMTRAAVLTEEISSKKYPEYKRYQQLVPMVYPWPWASAWRTSQGDLETKLKSA